jgi:hypothetical protein
MYPDAGSSHLTSAKGQMFVDIQAWQDRTQLAAASEPLRGRPAEQKEVSMRRSKGGDSGTGERGELGKNQGREEPGKQCVGELAKDVANLRKKWQSKGCDELQ